MTLHDAFWCVRGFTTGAIVAVLIALYVFRPVLVELAKDGKE